MYLILSLILQEPNVNQQIYVCLTPSSSEKTLLAILDKHPLEDITSRNDPFVHTHVGESLSQTQERMQDTQDGAVSSDSSAALEYATGPTEFRSFQSYFGSNSDSDLSYLKFDCQCSMCQNRLHLQESVSKNEIDSQTASIYSDSESATAAGRLSVHSI